MLFFKVYSQFSHATLAVIDMEQLLTCSSPAFVIKQGQQVWYPKGETAHGQWTIHRCHMQSTYKKDTLQTRTRLLAKRR